MAPADAPSLPRKLGIRAGHRVLLDAAPVGFADVVLQPLPEGVAVHRRAGATPYDVVLAFRRDATTFLERLDRDIARTSVDGALWVAWPKRASGVVTDLTDDIVRRGALAAGVVDVKVCAVDATWSALKLVRRLADR